MPRAAKACSQPRCPNLAPCPDHPKIPWAGSNRTKQLSSRPWERKRQAILARDPICTVCHNALSTEAHHLGNPNDHRLEQLAGICSPCHKLETQKQAAAARGGG